MIEISAPRGEQRAEMSAGGRFGALTSYADLGEILVTLPRDEILECLIGGDMSVGNVERRSTLQI